MFWGGFLRYRRMEHSNSENKKINNVTLFFLKNEIVRTCKSKFGPSIVFTVTCLSSGDGDCEINKRIILINVEG